MAGIKRRSAAKSGDEEIYRHKGSFIVCTAILFITQWLEIVSENKKREIKRRTEGSTMCLIYRAGRIYSNEVLRLFLLLLFKVRFICYTASVLIITYLLVC